MYTNVDVIGSARSTLMFGPSRTAAARRIVRWDEVGAGPQYQLKHLSQLNHGVGGKQYIFGRQPGRQLLRKS